MRSIARWLAVGALVGGAAAAVVPSPVGAAPVPAGRVLRVHVADAFGGKTVIGQLTVANATEPGHVTAFPCDDGLPVDEHGRVARSDLNYFGDLAPIWSNRLIVRADDDGDICFHALTTVDMIIDVNAVSFDTGITSFPNRRTDTRTDPPGRLDAGDTLQLHIPEATDTDTDGTGTGTKTVIGQLTVARATQPGHITAYPCADGPPTDTHGNADRSDLNYFGDLSPIWSNRLIVQADTNGNICFDAHTAVDLVVDINGVSDTGIFSFPNERTDTRRGDGDHEYISPPIVDGVPVWPPYTPLPPLDGVAALTGRPASDAVADRPIVAVKIDNYRLARPQWGLDLADAVIEVRVEGISRLIALYQSNLPTSLGPARSARTGDLDLLTAMNRPVFAFSGANPGVTAWVESADDSGLLVDFSAQTNGCYDRRDDRPGPHNLSFDAACAVEASPDAGAAKRVWSTSASWSPPADAVDDTTFTVPMTGVEVAWTWDATSGTYLRSQDGEPHMAEGVAEGDMQIEADTVVEVSTVYIDSIVDERSPHAITTGTGTAVVHRDGHAVEATWSRPTPYDPYVFRAADGTKIPLDVGTTWLELTTADPVPG